MLLHPVIYFLNLTLNKLFFDQDHAKSTVHLYQCIENLHYYKEILFIVFFQKLAYKIAIDKNINPDKPKNLAKVVTVE